MGAHVSPAKVTYPAGKTAEAEADVKTDDENLSGIDTSYA
jgi:hypothetical protein